MSGAAWLPREFYDRPVLEVAPDLVGCVVSHGDLSGVIVETEAYHQIEPACHAYVGLTPRTETLFGPPGRAYVYRSYGIHAMLNAVCEPEGVGAAVLIRALVPIAGVAEMRRRRGWEDVEDLCSGPGKLTQALGVQLSENGTDLAAGSIRIAPRPPDWRDPPLLTGRRVGITRGLELPWRFCAAGSRHVSSPRTPAPIIPDAPAASAGPPAPALPRPRGAAAVGGSGGVTAGARPQAGVRA